MEPRASIVIPVWNRAATLARAIDSLLRQTCPDFEVIVVDNGSSDGSRQVALASGDPRVRLITLAENLGPSGGRNAGAAVARASILGFLDSDDEVEPEWLEALLAPFSDARCAASSCAETERTAGAVRPAMPTNLSDMGPAFFGVRGRFRAGTFLLRKAVFDVIGGYAGGLWYAETTELTLRLTRWCQQSSLRIVGVERPLAIWNRASFERSALSTERVLAAGQYTLLHHRDQLARDRSLLASNYAVAGQSAARLGQLDTARRLFARAVVAQPAKLKHTARLLACCARPVAKYVWRPARPVHGP